ncbi:hypothetical protein D3C86_1692620 [compost metagenome]
MGMRRVAPLADTVSTWASSARSATAISDECTAMHCVLAPKIAWMRLKPSMAAQPLPGVRLLQGLVVS